MLYSFFNAIVYKRDDKQQSITSKQMEIVDVIERRPVNVTRARGQMEDKERGKLAMGTRYSIAEAAASVMGLKLSSTRS